VGDTALSDHLSAERSVAVRVLLGRPLLDAHDDAEGFRVVVRHAGWLVEYFERACGWTLTVDIAAGFARLAKRAAAVDLTRPLRRVRGSAAPFDRRRYQLLCLVCAELVRHPVTTVGLLAGAVTADAGLDTGRYGERAAFVDSLRVLVQWGAIHVTAGDVDSFVESERGNAILTADTVRLHRLVVSAAAPSALPEHIDADEAAERLLEEPRYGDDPSAAGEEERNRWVRHSLARRLLDDPVVHTNELAQTEADYLASPGGRRWLRERVAEAGLELEERAEGLLAIDPDAIATDLNFPAPHGHAHQLALLLADRLVTTDALGDRHLGRLTSQQLNAEVDAVFRRFPGWARGRREEGGPEHLGREAIELLASFGLVRCEPDGTVVARPALARYRVGDPVVSGEAPTLFEEAL
jgi:uncharacterized protein (TIGR02678 family)